MSFDVHVQLVDEYFDQGFPRSVVEEVFGPVIAVRDEEDGEYGVHLLSFPPRGGGGDLYLKNKPIVSGFAVMAAGGDGVYDAFYEVMRRVPYLYLYWPGGFVVSDPATIPLLPDGIEKVLGPAIVVHSGHDITEAIRLRG